VSPDNILLDEDGAAKLTDFDLVRMAESTGGTRTGALGKFIYAAPESLESGEHADQRCDVYSLGMTAIFAYHGKRLPHAAFTKRGHFLKQMDVPGPLKAVLARAIRHDPATRYGTVKEFCDAFRAAHKKRKRSDTPPAVVPVVSDAAWLETEGGIPASSDANRGSELRFESQDVAAPKAGALVTNSLGMKFAWCPPGTFLMGSPESEAEREDDELQHRVTLSKGFYLGIRPVTQAQWQAVMGTSPSHFKGDQLPVERVSWDDCQELLKKLGEKDGKRYRMPTEAEWEYACRAGTTTPFSFGKTITPEQANYNGNYPYVNAQKGNYREATTAVGTFPANAWGLYDMHGNVWEWCEDRYRRYSEGVVRGGSWRDGAWCCRSAFRKRREPGSRFSHLGCRVVFCLD
jgi:formylglycine-generating enzyme required for sulfatase activity